MSDELPQVLIRENEKPRRLLFYFLVFLCLVFTAFLVYANFFSNSVSEGTELVRLTRRDSGEVVLEEYCSELFRLVDDGISFPQSANQLADINLDGKIDRVDFLLILEKTEDEEWCQEVLTRK